MVSSAVWGTIPVLLQRIRTTALRRITIYVWFVALIVTETWGMAAPLLYIVFLGITKPELRAGALIILGLLFSIFAGVVLFAACVVLMRRTVREISRSSSPMKIAGLSLLNFLPAVILFCMVMGGFYLPNLLGRAQVPTMLGLIALGLFGLILNFAFVLSGIMFVFVAVTMFLHRCFWPGISRPLYKLQAMGVAKRPMLFRAIGGLLVGAAFGKHEWMWSILDKL